MILICCVWFWFTVLCVVFAACCFVSLRFVSFRFVSSRVGLFGAFCVWRIAFVFGYVLHL